MNYDSAELEKLEHVYSVFVDYIKSSQACEIVKSDKLGYVYLHIRQFDDGTYDADALTPWFIDDAESFCKTLLTEITYDVVYSTGKQHYKFQASDDELVEIKRRIGYYIDQLPEYAYLVDQLDIFNAE